MPQHFFALRRPVFKGVPINLFDAVALDLEGGRDQPAFHGPGLGYDDHAGQLLMRVQRGVDFGQFGGDAGLQAAAVLCLQRLLGRQHGKHQQRQGLAQVGADHTAGFDARRERELVFNRRGRHVFALVGLEQVFDAAGDLQVALGVHRAFVTGAQPAIQGQRFLAELRLLEVTQHQHVVLHLNLAVFGRQTALHTGEAQAHRAGAAFARQGRVRDATVFGHTVDLDHVQPQCGVPAQQVGRHGGGAAGGQAALVQAQGGEHFFAHQSPHDGNLEHACELGRQHLGVHAFLELDPQTRHREEKGRASPAHVLRKGVQRLGKKHVHAGGQQPVLDDDPLGNVRQRQVRQDAVIGRHGDARQAFGDGARKVVKAVHHPFGVASGSRGVHHRAQIVCGSHGLALQGELQLHNVLPLRARPFRPQGQTDARQMRGNARHHRFCIIEFAHKDQACAAVVQNVLNRFDGQGGIQGHGNMTSHPNGPIRHDPMRGVYGVYSWLGWLQGNLLEALMDGIES